MTVKNGYPVFDVRDKAVKRAPCWHGHTFDGGRDNRRGCFPPIRLIGQLLDKKCYDILIEVKFRLTIIVKGLREI